jgi:hypothetical protein
MDLRPELREDRRSRAMAATEILALALERNLPHMALAAAREAARSALLALAEAPPPRRLAGRDLELLKELAAFASAAHGGPAPRSGMPWSARRCPSWTACSSGRQPRRGAIHHGAAARDSSPTATRYGNRRSEEGCRHGRESRAEPIACHATPGEQATDGISDIHPPTRFI